MKMGLKIKRFLLRYSLAPPHKWRPAATVLVAVFFGLGLYLLRLSNAASYLSDDPQACVNCHIMTPQYITWNHSSHREVAHCNDCHVPQDNIVNKFYFKAKDGSRQRPHAQYLLDLQKSGYGPTDEENGRLGLVQPEILRFGFGGNQPHRLRRLPQPRNDEPDDHPTCADRGLRGHVKRHQSGVSPGNALAGLRTRKGTRSLPDGAVYLQPIQAGRGRAAATCHQVAHSNFLHRTQIGIGYFCAFRNPLHV
ncbi:cytochrome c nitrite reductase, small subunit [Cyclobacterium xiamenense]|uniref:Cytochrome c nitrite reductase, small subunit n=1 Tax=Cyclobacterium xiamenense TaxID=1297121 RepID=A0A1H6Z749_9BACT|nr:cytochrome c nitrite reductase, small subunit [Cyclobacterium xiamenense]